MGDVISITDAQGNELVQYEYDEWGAIGSITTTHNSDAENALANANPLRYRGYYLDSETGYYYLQSRYYDASICRFINSDDIVITGLSKSLYSGLNAYSYCRNNSINCIDKDGSNVAGVLCALAPEEKKKVEALVSSYVRPLPERDINKVISEPVGLIKSDAMLYCYEDWNPEQPVDARGMSDGTLRFIAIVVALLTVAPHSLLLIEEVDNGLHPFRAKELVDMLKDLSRQRQVDVLCTTHNPVLLDELGNKMIPFISYVTRDENGDSHVNLLEEKENLAKLMASGTIGRMMVNDKI